MNRIELCIKNREKLFKNGELPNVPNHDMSEILNYFIFGEVFESSELIDSKLRELITISILTTNQLLVQLKVHLEAALNIGASDVQIREAIYQCTPYIGFPKVLNALEVMNEVFDEKGIQTDGSKQKRVNEKNRFEKGLDVQKSIFGDVIDNMRKNAPKNQKHIQNYLSAMCFGDFYTRGGLSLKTREIITLCCLISLGGCESQVKAHIQGNINVGNTKDVLIAVITQCLPYVGFPRTLNALSCLNEIV